MRITLETIAGPCGARRFWLTPGASLRVGRTEDADQCFAEDGRMSRVHFVIECTSSSARVRDLGSSNGTHVNGRPATDVALNDGDQIRAGETVFRVSIAGAPAAGSPAPSARTTHSPTPAPPPTLPQPSPPARQPSPPSTTHASTGHTPPVHAPPVHTPPVHAPHARPPQLRTTAAASRTLAGATLELQGSQGRKIWLLPGQSTTVGRTDFADHSFSDETLDPVHFLVRLGGDQLRIEDRSDGGTLLVNDEPPGEGPLRDGDVIRAGRTTFVVRLQRLPGAEGETESADGWHLRLTPSGIHECIPPPALAWDFFLAKCAAERPLHLIVDYGQFDSWPPLAATPLLDWVPRSLGGRPLPVFIPAGPEVSVEHQLALARRAWGKNSVTAICSDVPPDQLLAHLRQLARGQSRPDAPPDELCMLGRFRPLDLAARLPQLPRPFAKYAFSQLSLLVCESNDGWRKWET